mmetsp:Transcript_105202/g.307541  ORF Transcript_105202/g.307541 Transcript_105202/m.307541 type:complete len:416 (-) Transcript_105202:61-1308(-)
MAFPWERSSLWRQPLLPLLLLWATLVPAGGEPTKVFRPGSQLPGRRTRLRLMTTDLNSSLTFYSKVLGMRILRHEEHTLPCKMTCNGPYNTNWSRTVVGYEPEVTNFALELVYNYGVSNYSQGGALRAIALRSTYPVERALEIAAGLGYTQVWEDGGFQLLKENEFTVRAVGYKLESYGNKSWLLVGPDNYRYLLLPPAPAAENFDHIRFHVRDLRASVDFYARLLGMTQYSEAAMEQGIYPLWVASRHALIGYSPSGGGNASGVPLLLEQGPEEVPVRVYPWDGRQIITLPYHKLRIVYTWIHHYQPWSLVHVLQYAPKEENSTLLSAVIKDPDGNEIMLAGAEIYDKEVQEATNFAEPDWELREEREMEASPVPDPPEEPMCELYTCPLTFPDPRPVLPPWHKWSEHPSEQVA